MAASQQLTNSPRYRQIADQITDQIRDGKWKPGDALPSLSMISKQYQVSRDTALAVYKELKYKGIVNSVSGKGYFLTANSVELERTVFLLFDEFNSFKENLYNSFKDSVGRNTRVDIYFHNFNYKTFKQQIEANAGSYSHYIVMPARFDNVEQVLQLLPQSRTYILDQSTPRLDFLFSSIYQDFEKDVYRALSSKNELLEKYEQFIMIHPGGKEPEGQKKGFIKYCERYQRSYFLLDALGDRKLNKGEVYITPSDRDLVELVKRAAQAKLKLGEDLGIVSYNDTPLKEVVGNGITTISTDFVEMGKSLARLLETKGKLNIHNPASLVIRKSI